MHQSTVKGNVRCMYAFSDSDSVDLLVNMCRLQHLTANLGQVDIDTVTVTLLVENNMDIDKCAGIICTVDGGGPDAHDAQ